MSWEVSLIVANIFHHVAAVSCPILRIMFDRMLPMTLFGVLSLGYLRRTAEVWVLPSEPSAQGSVVHVLALGHAVLGVVFMVLLTILFVIRRTPISQRAAPIQMLTALGGTFIMWIALAQPSTIDDWRVLALADLLMIVGLAFTIYALGALRACFGLAPEARGLVTSGAYRWVRHPVYVGEFVIFFGALLPVLAPLTVVIFCLFCLLQARRAQLEEAVLSATFPEYAVYSQQTPALLPWARA